MFDRDAFVADCRSALTHDRPIAAVKEVLERALTRPGEIAGRLPAAPGVTVLHRSPDLSVIGVFVPAGAPPTLPHDHRMWALVGIYGGQEDNEFFRRAGRGLEPSGGRSLRVGDTLAMGDDTVHAIQNPLDHSALAAIHVYGGDIVGTARSMWSVPGYEEQPYDATSVIGAPMRE